MSKKNIQDILAFVVQPNWSKKTQLLFFLLILFIFYSAALILNIETPLVIDDFSYFNVIPKGNWSTQLNGILESQYDHYFTWGGRTIVHIIAQLLLLADPLLADILNSFAYIAYALLIYYLIKGRGKHDVLLFALINLLIWVVQPEIGETMLWITGSANYLWGTSLVLLFILPYRLYQAGDVRLDWLKSIGMFTFGIFAGWTHENGAIAAIVIIATFLVYYRINKRLISYWSIFGFIGLLIGSLILILAPGNMARAEVIGGAESSTITDVCVRFFVNSMLFVKILGGANLIGIILLLFYSREISDKMKRNNLLLLCSLFMFGTLASIYIMIFSPVFPTRAWFTPVTFNIIVLGLILYNVRISDVVFKSVRLLLVTYLSVVFLYSYTEGYKDVKEMNDEWNSRKAEILVAKENGTDCVFDMKLGRTKFSSDDTIFMEGSISKYFGVTVKWSEDTSK